MIYLALFCAFLFGLIAMDLWRDRIDARIYADEWDQQVHDWANDVRRDVPDERREEWWE